MEFTPSAQEKGDEGPAWLFIFAGNDILVTADTGHLPCLEPDLAPAGTNLCPFGALDGTPCLCGSLRPDAPAAPFIRANLRKFYQGTGDDFREAAAFARLVADLHANSRFCGRCGAPTTVLEGEHARFCPACRLTSYPRISPAVIMAVTREDRILLARGVNFPDKRMFSVLAGFVSPAETLEDCVKREVFEETRIRVKNVKYVESQPWPFPDSLMIGFTAEYDSGEIEIDPNEIAEAGWFSKDDLPSRTPADYTLAGRLIGEFRRSGGRP